jgi:stage III sporulation protein AG
MKLAELIKTFLSGDRKLGLIVALGLAGMLLVLLSQFLPGKPSEVDSTTAEFANAANDASSEYLDALEGELTALLTGIEGVGRAEVMVTLQNGVEYRYAKEAKASTDTTREGGEETATRVHEKVTREETFLLVEQNGQRQPLLQTELQPKIQGVVIVCEGADDPRVQLILTSVVTTALDIPSTKVCIAKIGSK